MKFFSVLSITIFLFASTISAKFNFTSAHIQKLKEKYGLKKAKVGIVVGKPFKKLFSFNENTLFVPASLSKIVTAFAAYLILGSNYRFKTLIFADKKKNLYIKGSGDPFIFYKDLLEIGVKLRNLGIKKVKNIYIDTSVFDKKIIAPGFDLKKSDQAYTSPVFGFSCELNRILIKISKKRSKKAKPEVVIFPPSRYVKVENRAKYWSKNRSDLSIKAVKSKYKTVIKIKGRVSKNGLLYTLKKKIYDPFLFVASLLRSAFSFTKIKITGKIKKKEFRMKKPILIHSSPPLFSIVSEMLKNSNNFIAEMLLKKVCASEYYKSSSCGANRIKRLLLSLTMKKGFKINKKEFVFKNGSGLYDLNRFTPMFLFKLLSKIYESNIKFEFLSSLSVSGKDGTLKKRLKTVNFRGKTGTLDNSITLSGFLFKKNRAYIVVIMLNGDFSTPEKRYKARKFIDEVILKLNSKLSER